MGSVFSIYLLAFVVIIIFFKLIRIVPEQQSYVIEQFGKYSQTLGADYTL